MTSSHHYVRIAVTIAVSVLLLIIEPSNASAQTEDEEAVKQVVENFLVQLGDGNLDEIPDMFVPDANIGTAALREGSWVTSTMTFEAWMASLRERTPWARFREPVSEYDIRIEESMMAFVRADATLVSDGQARSRNIDYFTLVRQDGEWRILSASYVARPIASE